MSKKRGSRSTTLKAGWDEDSFHDDDKQTDKAAKPKATKPKAATKPQTQPKTKAASKTKAADAKPYVFTPTDDGALTTALKEYGRAWSTIQKEYFPHLKPKQIQNHVMSNEKLKVNLFISSLIFRLNK